MQSIEELSIENCSKIYYSILLFLLSSNFRNIYELPTDFDFIKAKIINTDQMVNKMHGNAEIFGEYLYKLEIKASKKQTSLKGAINEMDEKMDIFSDLEKSFEKEDKISSRDEECEGLENDRL